MTPDRSAHNLLHAQCIVLRTHPFAESDTIARVLTPALGKIGLIAKRSREQSRRQLQIETFDIGELDFVAGKGELYKLRRFVALNPLRKIRSDLDKLNIASVTCEAYDLLTKEGQGIDISLFDALSLSLQAIDNAQEIKTSLKACYIALNHLIRISGFGLESLPQAASLKRLNVLLDHVETCAERALNSRKMLQMTLDSVSAVA